MLRPERMSRVSVTGSKRVMEEAIEAVHDLNVVHVTDYDGAWEGFDPGDPTEGADEAAEKLVTVRALKSILDVEEADAGPARIVSGEEIETELEDVRGRVNELDDRRDDIGDELRSIEERVAAVEPFVELGIDLDLLSGYENLSVAVGEGDEAAVKRELGDVAGIEQFEVFSGSGEGDALAVFAYPDVDLSDALVGARFSAVEVPDLETVREAVGGDAVDPEAYVDALDQRRRELESTLSTVESELEEVRAEVWGFLLAAEEQLAIEVQKREAPLSFATTENAFVAEGWIPTERFVDLVEGLHDAVGDHVEVEELERADYDGEGHATDREEVGGGAPGGDPTAADGGTVTDGGEPTGRSTDLRSDRSEGTAASGTDDEEIVPDGGGASGASRASTEPRSDGGHAHGGDRPMSDSEPPVIQDNPGPAKPFEALVEIINRPKYSELDPTVVLFLTFPLFFGFMIGDVGYGLIYVALGYLMYTRLESDVLRALGGIGLWSGAFTILFGVLYGEFFGLHQLGEIVWGTPPLHKGLSPEHADWALGWLVISLLAGIVHLAVGWIFDFYENLDHGFEDAMLESGSWLLMLFGLWAWILAGASGSAPDLLYGADSVFNGHPFAFGFAGFPSVVGLVGLAVFLVGLVLLLYGEPIEGVEFLNVLVNVLSYTRIAAVLLAKAGMAFVVNLLFFGVYVDAEGAWHFGTGGMPAATGVEYHGHEVAEIMFGGLLHGGILWVLVGIVILVLGHLLVMVLGITSAGLQAVRLEYVEFFGKFFEGGGRAFAPFGYERTYTTED
ncbi:V-type ATP synthase subunit I [Halobacteriales archaeon QS_5_70_15]|nr:MAG: V-type ATP synthase subunit I [Halobacteriales archaeon QS_5_70_15]